MTFSALSRGAQVIRLRRLAVEALRERGFDPAAVRLRLLEHGFNTTFRVDTADGRRYALRISVNSVHTPAHVRAEVQWLAALADEGVVHVPTPIPAPDGRRIIEVPSSDLGRSLQTVLFAWLPGGDVGDAPTPAKWRAAGAAMARLHVHGRSWRPVGDARLPDVADPLQGVPYRLDLVVDADRGVLDEALARSATAYAALPSNLRQPIHADVHGWNLKWYRGRLAVLDFDDCGVGFPVQDLAICQFYLRDDEHLVDALIDGYRSVAPLPQSDPANFEAMVAGRSLVLLNDLLVTTNAAYVGLLPRYTANTVLKMRHFLDTGTFRHEVPGVLPLT